MVPNLTKAEKKIFLDMIHLIKKTYPAAYPIKIRTYKRLPGNCFGDTELIKETKPYFLVRLKRNGLSEMLETAVHELSHCLNFNFYHWEHRYEDVEYHCVSWGTWYAKLYQLVFSDGTLSKKCLR